MHCRRQLGDLAKVRAELAAEGIGLAAISVDSAEDSRALAQRLGIDFPLLEDPGAEVAARYGVKMKGATLAIPATFVVRSDRTIAWEYLGEAASDRPELDVVRAEASRPR